MMRRFWIVVYAIIGRRPPQVWWKNEYGNSAGFSKGFNPNGVVDNTRWWRINR